MSTNKTKAQLLEELEALRSQVAAFEESEAERKQAEKESKLTSEHLSLLADTLPIVPFTSEAEGDFAVTYVDKSVTAVTGYQPQDLTSDPSFWSDRIHADDREQIFSQLSHLFDTGHHERVYRWRVADGTYKWFWDTLRLFSRPDGTKFIVGTWHDVTRQKSIEEELSASQARFLRILDSASSAIISVDVDQRIILFNSQAERTFGYQAEEILGKPLDILIPDRFSEAHRDHVGMFATQDAPARGMSERPMSLFGQRKNGEEFQIEVAISRFEEGGKPIFTAVLNEITERVEAENALRESEERLRAFATAIPEVALILDEDGQYMEVLTSQEDLLFMDAEQLKGRRLHEIFPKERADTFLSLIRKTIETEEPQTLEYELDVLGGHAWFAARTAPMSSISEGPRMVVMLARDITDHKLAEQELEARNLELEAYSHTIAHDLKAPLNLITGYSDLLLSDHGSASGEERGYLQIIQDTAMKMADMINQLLWLAKLRDTTEAIACVEMMPIVEDALARFKDRIDELNIAIDVAPDLPPAMAHDIWVEEVFANLIGNAIKYIGEDNPSPQITIKGKVQGKRVRYEVQDNGLGVPIEEQDRLFEMFFRVHHTGSEGLGLGLSIVKRIVTKLGGEVGIESSPGEGSVFWFTLLAPEPEVPRRM
jgi:PAS domain S-box-containing protein